MYSLVTCLREPILKFRIQILLLTKTQCYDKKPVQLNKHSCIKLVVNELGLLWEYSAYSFPFVKTFRNKVQLPQQIQGEDGQLGLDHVVHRIRNSFRDELVHGTRTTWHVWEHVELVLGLLALYPKKRFLLHIAACQLVVEVHRERELDGGKELARNNLIKEGACFTQAFQSIDIKVQQKSLNDNIWQSY